jgi:catalase
LEKATGVKGDDGISGLVFNGTHSGMAEDRKFRVANWMKGVSLSRPQQNGRGSAGSWDWEEEGEWSEWEWGCCLLDWW